MANGQPAAQPSGADIIASLASAADAARQAYLVALAANPAADLGELYSKEMAAQAVWSAAEKKHWMEILASKLRRRRSMRPRRTFEANWAR
jgi:hypothetical protein